ncbi:MAG: hypothetical protein GY817_01105 [bacterium]|nr:hypothetical protein [bacterium]
MSNIIDKDLGYSKIVRSLKDIEGSHVKVGLQGAKGQKTYGEKFNNMTVVDIGTIHEFGANIHKQLKPISLKAGLKAYNSNKMRTGLIKIPARSFLGTTYDKKHKEWIEMNKKLFWNIITARYSKSFISGISKALGIMGQTIVKDIRKTIRAGIEPPNKESTLRAKMKKGKGKKTPKPLIDTGRMINSISYKKEV